jgi:hypothetical protein
MQLKHLPFCFLVVAGICLAGAVSTSGTTIGNDDRQAASSR